MVIELADQWYGSGEMIVLVDATARNKMTCLCAFFRYDAEMPCNRHLETNAGAVSGLGENAEQDSF